MMINFIPVVVCCFQLYPINIVIQRAKEHSWKEERLWWKSHLPLFSSVSGDTCKMGDTCPAHFLLSVTRNLSYQKCSLPDDLKPKSEIKTIENKTIGQCTFFFFEKFAMNLKDRAKLPIWLPIKQVLKFLFSSS